LFAAVYITIFAHRPFDHPWLTFSFLTVSLNQDFEGSFVPVVSMESSFNVLAAPNIQRSILDFSNIIDFEKEGDVFILTLGLRFENLIQLKTGRVKHVHGLSFPGISLSA
jgi:hypothetical protein